MSSWVPYQKDINDEGTTGKDVGVAIGLFLLLIYLFIGIAFASDIFMNAIEKICGSTKTVKVVKEDDGVVVTVTKNIPIWNETVANLTLMALGSSAPEILLSSIETVQGLGDNYPGELGPGTIVGSAAFNLLVISAVCIFTVGQDRVSRIKMYKVFIVTSIFSIFAYFWMLIVLEWSSKDIVTIPEGVMTLLFCPIMVVISYWAHRDFCMGRGGEKRPSTSSSSPTVDEDNDRQFYFGDETDNLYDTDGNVDKAALKNLYKQLTELADLTPDEAASILATKLIQSKKHTRMWYRSQMTRYLMGGAKLTPVLNEKLQEVVGALNSSRASQPEPIIQASAVPSTVTSADTYKKKAVVEFQAASLAVAEAIGSFNVDIFRTGKEDTGFKIKVETYDGSAKKNKEYQPVSEVLTFDPYVKENKVEVKIVDNAHWNPDSNFYIKFSVLPEYEAKAVAGPTHVMEIIIQDDDKPGKLSFTKRGYVVKATAKIAHVEIERNNGTDGVVSVSWKTIPGPECKLVKELEGKLEFQAKEMRKFINIPFTVNSEGPVEGDKETFEIELHSPTGGAKLGKIPKTTCALTSEEGFKLNITDDVMNTALEISEKADEDTTYGEQIAQSFCVNGGDYENATTRDWALHIITFPYKVAFSFIPPTNVGCGYPTFVIALLVVGLLTKIVGDAATSFGIALGWDPVMTAITIVALGTSLPDTFASRISAQNDPTADNAIGNITGSNGVNVFLGLGIPWTIASIYHNFFPNKSNGTNGNYCVPAGSLTFNVLIFAICAILTIAILTYRRHSESCGEAELGGPMKMKIITGCSMLVLWVLYIALSYIQIYLANLEKGKGQKDISEDFMVSTEPTVCLLHVKTEKLKREGATTTTPTP